MRIGRRVFIGGLLASAVPELASAKPPKRRSKALKVLPKFNLPFDIIVTMSGPHEVRARLREVNATLKQRAVISRSIGNALQFSDLFVFDNRFPGNVGVWKPRSKVEDGPRPVYYRIFGGIPGSSGMAWPDLNATVSYVISGFNITFVIGTDDIQDDHDNNDKIIELELRLPQTPNVMPQTNSLIVFPAGPTPPSR